MTKKDAGERGRGISEGDRRRKLGALASLLAAGALLIAGTVSTRNAVAGSSPSAGVERASAPSAVHYVDADRDTLDLQLD